MSTGWGFQPRLSDVDVMRDLGSFCQYSLAGITPTLLAHPSPYGAGSSSLVCLPWYTQGCVKFSACARSSRPPTHALVGEREFFLVCVGVCVCGYNDYVLHTPHPFAVYFCWHFAVYVRTAQKRQVIYINSLFLKTMMQQMQHLWSLCEMKKNSTYNICSSSLTSKLIVFQFEIPIENHYFCPLHSFRRDRTLEEKAKAAWCEGHKNAELRIPERRKATGERAWDQNSMKKQRDTGLMKQKREGDKRGPTWLAESQRSEWNMASTTISVSLMPGPPHHLACQKNRWSSARFVSQPVDESLW